MPEILPPQFDLGRFGRIANMESHNPEDFAQLNRHGQVTGPIFYKKFGSGTHCACLIQRNSPVLMVAHVDTVLPLRGAVVVLDSEKNRLLHPGLDNRLGVYLGLEVLPAMNLHVDLLLTTDEEQAASTAAIVHTRKPYNWIFSFDRKGTDVVCYQYDNPHLYRILTGAGFEVGHGSYSCVSDLEHLGACGINFGCGMANYHSEGAYCDLAQLTMQLKRFSGFYHDFSELWFPHRSRTGGVDHSKMHCWAVTVESWLWQYEYHRNRGAMEAARDCHRYLTNLLTLAPELRKEFPDELSAFPEFSEGVFDLARA